MLCRGKMRGIMPGNNRYARVCAGPNRSEKNFKRVFGPQFFSRAEKGQKCCGSVGTASAPQAIFGKTTENSPVFCCFPGWSWRNGYITAIFRAQFAAERIMPGYARGLQNPDYAPNYAIMPEHNGEDPSQEACRAAKKTIKDPCKKPNMKD